MRESSGGGDGDREVRNEDMGEITLWVEVITYSLLFLDYEP